MKMLIINLLNRRILLIINLLLIFFIGYGYHYLTINNELLRQQISEIFLLKLKNKQEENTKLVIDALVALARNKTGDIWLEKAIFDGDKCELSLKLKGMSEISNFYNYIFLVLQAKSSLKILSCDIQKKDYKSLGDKQKNVQSEAVPFVIAYLQKQKASLGHEKKSKNNQKKEQNELPYNYEYNVKLSICN